MEVSKTVDYVMNEASVEAKRGMKRFISQEHIFLGILKLTGITASDITDGREDNAQALSGEISELKQLFEQTFEIRIDHMTQILRLETMLSRKVVPADADALQNRAKEIAGMRGSSVCCAVDLLNVILENPPETLRAAMRIERWKDRFRVDVLKPEASVGHEDGCFRKGSQLEHLRKTVSCGTGKVRLCLYRGRGA